MKKSILFGALAFFAISAMNIQSAEAQNPVKKHDAKTEVKQDKTAVEAATTTATAPVGIKINKKAASDDCCAKKNSADCKKKLSTSTESGKKKSSVVKSKASAKKAKATRTTKVDK